VDHLNRGRKLIVDRSKIDELRGLNLQAAVKARDAAAYELALTYCETGLDLMGPDGWLDQYSQMLALKSEYMRCAYLWGEYDQSEQAAEDILAHVKTPEEKASILAMLTRQHATTGKMDQSIAAAIEGLKVLGIDFLDDPNEADLDAEIEAVARNLKGRKIAELIDAPEIESSEKIIAIELLMEIFAAAFLSGRGTLFPYLVLKSVNLSLVHGNSPQSAFTYAAYGMILCGRLHNPALGYEYGRLALAINEKFDDIKLKSRVIYVYGMFIHHWSNHWSSLTEWFQKGIEAGYQSGDLLYLAYSAQDCIIWDPTLDLQTASAEQRKYLAIVRDCEYQDSLDSGSLFLQMLQNFQGLTNDRFSLTDENFDEREVFAGMLKRGFMTGIANYHIYKTEIHYFYDDYQGAYEHVIEQDKLIYSSMSLPQLVRYIFVSFLTRSSLFSKLGKRKQIEFREKLKADIAQMQAWADNCEANFRHLQYAMEAELARLDDKPYEAIEKYTHAINLAGKNKFYRDEAMINELTGKHFLNIGFTAAADGYLQKAMVLYESWGAKEKTSQLIERYPAVFVSGLPAIDLKTRTHRTGSGTIDQNAIDLESVMKASHAISGEIVLSRLWETVMEILLENAGAQRGYFVWIRDGEMYLGAKAGNTPKKAVPSLVEHMKPKDAQSWLSTSIINYVVRSKEHVVLDDATQSERFSSDAYVMAERPKSVLCIPVSQSGQFVSAIYLENNLATGAFSESRIEVLKLLAAQAAISIENAQLYDNLEAEVEARTKELHQKTNALERLSNQLSKYLSPQVYQSIFDSKQEARLVSARKRLTVFFSDIVGFTAAADRLESEELTQLLNHYLTEMSQIAIAYGATVDKFVGDAIVIFFGDPETQGNKDDALSCVKMAIAMRTKMRDLIGVWQSMGIEFPLHCRMGINTGYCTVGNFGSEDRMDYTIIGGTVNLAARLESAAQPDEILVSYETYALIKDEIYCEEMEPMTVKGISHAITTYRVIDLVENIDDHNKVVRTESKNLKLDMDISKMSPEERSEAAKLFEAMVKRLSDDQ
jgi:class 3 adenylate cyclase